MVDANLNKYNLYHYDEFIGSYNMFLYFVGFLSISNILNYDFQSLKSHVFLIGLYVRTTILITKVLLTLCLVGLIVTWGDCI